MFAGPSPFPPRALDGMRESILRAGRGRSGEGPWLSRASVTARMTNKVGWNEMGELPGPAHDVDHLLCTGVYVLVAYI